MESVVESSSLFLKVLAIVLLQPLSQSRRPHLSLDEAPPVRSASCVRIFPDDVKDCVTPSFAYLQQLKQ